MRQRTKVGASLCSHTTPNGKAYMGEMEVLRKKFSHGDITKEELKRYADFMVVTKKISNMVTVKILNGTVTISRNEYEKTYKPLGFVEINNP